jgi:D-beta-D-heptose 7-phosphate kinase/D-beta-D-heptose 1-phosphate adenosyltransferase
MNTRLVEIVGRLKAPRIFVLGDLILDKYVWGSVSRISPEAPVPVVNVKGEEYRGGGAAASLGRTRAARPCSGC